MSNARNNYAVNVSENFFERRTNLRGIAVQLRKNFSRLHIARNRAFANLFAIIRNPIRQLVQLLTEFRDRNIAEFLEVARFLSIFHSSERETETEVKRTKIFTRRAVWIPSIIEPDRTDR